ncbi:MULTISPECIES: hypothetical protein [Burkholderia]|nr:MULTISPECIES: hypothetical protein [Burkholderia]
MPLEWTRNTVPSAEREGIPNEDFPIMVIWYGALDAQLDGKTRRVQVAFQRVDGEPEGPFFRDVAFSHLDALQLGSVWQRRRRIGEANLILLQPTAADFSAGGWRIMSAKSEADNGRPAPLNGKYPVFHEDEREERSKLLELSLLDGRKLIVPCMEFLLRGYGESALIPRALTSMNWEDALGMFLTNTTPEKNSDGAWMVRLADRMQLGDIGFLGHIQHVGYSRAAAQSIVQQCTQQATKRKWIHLEVAPWFSGPVHVSAEGIWVRKGTFLALRFELNGHPEADGPEIEVVKSRKEEVTRSEWENSDNVAREGSPVYTLSPESKMAVRSFDNFDNAGLAPPEANGGPKRKIILGPRRKHTVTYENRPDVIIPPTLSGTPDVRLDPSNIEDIAEAHRMVVAHGTLLEMWKELRRLQLEHRETFHSLEWLHVKRGFVNDEPPELVGLQPFSDTEPAEPKARKFVTRDIKTEEPRGVLVLRFRVTDPGAKGWREFYLLEIERRYEQVKVDGIVIRKEEDGCQGLVATLAPETQFREWLAKTLSDIRHVVGQVAKLRSTEKAQLVTFKHVPSRKDLLHPLRTSAALVFTKANVTL